MGKNWQKVKLVSTRLLAPNIKSFTFLLNKPISFKSGQYFDLRLIDSNSKSIRSFSIASSPKEKDFLEFVIQKIETGKLSPNLFGLKPGEKIEIKGPQGNFFWTPKEDKDLVLIAGGTGVTPFISLLRNHQANFKNRKILLIYSVSSEEFILYKDELENFQKKDINFKIVYIFTKTPPKNWQREGKRLDLKTLESILKDISHDSLNIYLAGSTAFVENIFSSLIKLNFKTSQIRRERFGPFIYE